MATSVSANRKRASQHLAISVYVINRIIHAPLWIRILSSRVQVDIHEREQRKSEISSWTLEDKIHMHKRASNILYVYKYVILEFFCEQHQIKFIF